MIAEVLHMQVNDYFSAKPELYDELRKGAEKGGLARQSYGVSVEDPRQLYWILHFENGFLPKDFVWPEDHGSFPEKLGAISTTEPVSYFMPFDVFPKETTAAPVTELAVLTLKPNIDIVRYNAATEKLKVGLRKTTGVHGADSSITETGSRRAYTFVGWDSVEAHISFAESEAGKELLQSLAEFLEKAEVVHVKFTDHV
ncbi:hypothetical protein AcV5_006739 [Taiwanofungus camphoratus]|nr:hypothetical protein AcV5_006739 [Antrodia cinnamomea]